MAHGNILEQLIKLFFRGSINFTLENEFIKQLDWDMQEKFLKATVQSTLLKKFPVRLEFYKLFFKKLITYLEPYHEIHDEFYVCICSAINSSSKQFYYRHYVIDDNLSSIISIKETSNMVVDGTTGMRTWEASLILCDWALSNKLIFENKNVLELGSGVGFAGVTIAKYCMPASVIMTDYHDGVLKTIKENIDINNCNMCETKIGIMNLDWTNIAGLSNEIKPDIIIGADIVYDPSILKSLCSTLTLFYKRNFNLEVYICSIIRNYSTYKQFLIALGAADLSYEEIAWNNSVHLYWDNNLCKSFIKVKRK